MHVLVLGGTGAAGVLVVRELLASPQNHTIVVYARSPQKLSDEIAKHTRVTVKKGELTDRDALDSALEGVHAVTSALGPSVRNGPFHPSGTPIAKAYALLIELMRARGIRRLVALGTASIRDPNDKFSIQFAALVSGVAIFARNAYKDVIAIGETIRAAGELGLVYTIVRVPILDSKTRREWVAGYVGDGKTSTILSRLTFAAFVVHELETNEWAKKAPLISSAWICQQ